MALKPKVVPIAPDPQMRVDVLVLNLAEAGVRWAEQRARKFLPFPIELWGGDTGVKAVLEAKLDEMGVPREKITPAMLARTLGLTGNRKRRAG